MEVSTVSMTGTAGKRRAEQDRPRVEMRVEIDAGVWPVHGGPAH
jgi:hypothetical protein